MALEAVAVRRAGSSPVPSTTALSARKSRFSSDLSMKFPISALTMPHYSEANKDAEPSAEEIKLAVESNQLEKRGYQSDADELGREWREKSHGGVNVDEWVRLVREYHVRRTAYFVVHGWEDPITVNAEKTVMDGTHRYRAARYLGRETIEATVLPPG
jgi:hypothetical protein